MNLKKEKINTKLKELGQMLGLDEVTCLKSKRNVRNIIALAIVTGAILALGSALLPGGAAGYYYGGGGISDFKLMFKGLF